MESTEPTKKKMKESSPAPQSDDFHGVLKFRRECKWDKLDIVPPQTSDHTVWCEFCGTVAKPLLDFSKTPTSEKFCCDQYMELFKKLERQWVLLQDHSGEASQELHLNKEKLKKYTVRARYKDVLQKVTEASRKKVRRLPSEKPNEGGGCRVSTTGTLTTINFRLSEYIRGRQIGHMTARNDRITEEKPATSQLCIISSSPPTGFGLCHHQGHVQKFYSNGNKFLTTLPDGTAQVFYPSGNLAIIAFIDDTEGVCIVLDDESSCPIRAFFQSGGIAECYHSNKSIWLHMDMWGGRSVNEDRSKRRTWQWKDHISNPTFKPTYLSLNKNIGVRVRGQEFVLVTFLASGQQARFSVGSCTQTSMPAPSLEKEELMLQVSQLNARMALERLRSCLSLHWDTQRRSVKPPPFLISQARRLLRLSASIQMGEDDKAYIQHCLRDAREP